MSDIPSRRDFFAVHAPDPTDDELERILPKKPVFNNSGYFGGVPHESIRKKQKAEIREWERQARVVWRFAWADQMIEASKVSIT